MTLILKRHVNHQTSTKHPFVAPTIFIITFTLVSTVSIKTFTLSAGAVPCVVANAVYKKFWL